MINAKMRCRIFDRPSTSDADVFSLTSTNVLIFEYIVNRSETLVGYVPRRAEGYLLVRVGTGYKFAGRTMVELPGAPPGNPLSDDYVRELADKCRVKLETGDYDGAITNARTLLEAVLGELEELLSGTRRGYAGDLPRQYKAVSRMLRLDDDREDLDARFKDVVRGLVTVVNGLAPLRNKLSDGHARVRMPARHHAEVVVNAATTVAVFLGQSYEAQADAGRFLKPSKTD